MKTYEEALKEIIHWDPTSPLGKIGRKIWDKAIEEAYPKSEIIEVEQPVKLERSPCGTCVNDGCPTIDGCNQYRQWRTILMEDNV